MTAVDLAYDDVGEGPVVVLIHGHPFNRSMWAPQLDALQHPAATGMTNAPA
jgi:3-oxoadipate enol-lactonase